MVTRLLKRHWLGVIAGAFALILLYIILEWLRLDAGAIAAGASALAAVAAWASATTSSNTARDALRALSYATKPVLSVQIFNLDEEGSHLLIVNESSNPIARLRVTWRYRDGSSGSREYGYLPGTKRFGAPADGRVIHEFGNKGQNSGTDAITIDYWGTAGPVGWRIPLSWKHDYTSNERTSTYGRQEFREPEQELP